MKTLGNKVEKLILIHFWNLTSLRPRYWGLLLFLLLFLLLLLRKPLFILCVYVPEHMYVHPERTRPSRGQKRVLDTLELELQVVVNFHMGAGNWTWVLCRVAIFPDPAESFFFHTGWKVEAQKRGKLWIHALEEQTHSTALSENHQWIHSWGRGLPETLPPYC